MSNGLQVLESSHFGQEYVRYWKDRVVGSPDGTPASSPAALLRCLSALDLGDGQTVVDLGCGFGRMFPLLQGQDRNVVGVDLSAEMIDAARSLSYTSLVRGSVEDTRLPTEWVDRILCWATFDVAEQEDGLREWHRILRPGGRILFTGKNDLYFKDDEAALVAERNAFLKNFPNHFTDVATILRTCRSWGFEVRQAWGYRRRGDLGMDRAFSLMESVAEPFYEYALVLEKTASLGEIPRLCDVHSRTLVGLLRSRGVSDIQGYLACHKTEFGESFPLSPSDVP